MALLGDHHRTLRPLHHGRLSFSQEKTQNSTVVLSSATLPLIPKVSYKWLSRNYLLPSNTAKSLLQEFVEKHGKELAVVYALYGWLKSSPSSYHIRLVSGPKLDGVGADLRKTSVAGDPHANSITNPAEHSLHCSDNLRWYHGP